jgi:predicted nucleotidyltransferase
MGKIIPEMGKNMMDNSLCNGLFGKTRQAVLALLYGQADTSFYTKQILDAVKTGRGTVQRELKNLTDAGIIIREVQGRQVYYRANEKCPIYNELKSIVRKTFGVADVLRQSLAPKADKVRLAFIFGSVARSADDRRSDIDLIVAGGLSFGDVVSLLSPAEEKLGREVNPVVYPIAEFKKKVKEDHHFVKTVLEGEKIFLIGDEDELGRLAKE